MTSFGKCAPLKLIIGFSISKRCALSLITKNFATQPSNQPLEITRKQPLAMNKFLFSGRPVATHCCRSLQGGFNGREQHRAAIRRGSLRAAGWPKPTSRLRFIHDCFSILGGQSGQIQKIICTLPAREVHVGSVDKVLFQLRTTHA